MFLGFAMAAPGNPHVPTCGDLLFMAYTIDEDDGDESDDDESDESSTSDSD